MKRRMIWKTHSNGLCMYPRSYFRLVKNLEVAQKPVLHLREVMDAHIAHGDCHSRTFPQASIFTNSFRERIVR